jgi:hypothetical protein
MSEPVSEPAPESAPAVTAVEATPTPPVPATPLTLSSLPIPPKLSALIVTSYTGSTDDEGRYSGQGSVVFTDGNSYTGSFENGQMHGEGAYTFADKGIVYTGSVVYNKIEGKGKYQWADGSLYEGDVRDGLRHGTGTYTSADGSSVYEGGWVNGVREGDGVCYYSADKSSYYSGTFQNNVRHGQGTVVYPSGNKYTGSWDANRKCGRGVMVWNTLGERYDGNWKDDLQHGHGTHVWLQSGGEDEEGHVAGGGEGRGDVARQRCNMYTGSFVNGMREGNGTFLYANGAQYTGQWISNVKQGYGVYTYADGHIYEGDFVDDRMPLASTRSTEDVSVQIVLTVDDILPKSAADTTEHEMKLLQNSLLRYHSELKVCYKHYCAVPTILGSPSEDKDGVENADTTFTMTLDQFRIMCIESKIIDQGCTVGEVLFKMRRHHANSIMKVQLANGKDKSALPVYQEEEGENNTNSIHNPNRPILFREFVEALVRLAHCKFCITNPEISVRDAVKAVMEDHVRVYATQPGLNMFEEKLCETKVRNVFMNNETLLKQVFDEYKTGGGDETMTKKNWLLFCMDAAAFNKINVDSKEALALASRDANGSNHHHHSGTSLFADEGAALNDKMLYSEFCEAIGRLAHFLKKDQVPLQEKIKALMESVVAPLAGVLSKGGDEKQALEGQKVIAAKVKKAGKRGARKTIL